MSFFQCAWFGFVVLLTNAASTVAEDFVGGEVGPLVVLEPVRNQVFVYHDDRPTHFMVKYTFDSVRSSEAVGCTFYVDDEQIIFLSMRHDPLPPPFLHYRSGVFMVDIVSNITEGDHVLSVVPVSITGHEIDVAPVEVPFSVRTLKDKNGVAVTIRHRQHGHCTYRHLAPRVATVEGSNSFLRLACAEGTDKVADHAYHIPYERYLEPLRHVDNVVKLLEIGLGCDMSYGGGASAEVWVKYFGSKLELHVAEIDAECMAHWSLKGHGTAHVGDQNDLEFLSRIVSKSGGNFDVIIDDGGHTMQMQTTTFHALFDSLAPGGLYFIEDTSYSYAPSYGGGVAGAPGTTIEMTKGLLDSLHCQYHGGPCRDDIEHIDCYKEMCVFVKASTPLILT